MYLDYNLKTSAERINHVQKILSSGAPVSKSFLEYAADYILFMREGGQTKSEKNAEHPMQTANRATTVSKRETSLEQIVLSLENGEDGLYALINNDKNQLLDRKEKIEESQYEKNPLLTEKRKQIESLTAQFKETPKGKKRYLLKKQIIET